MERYFTGVPGLKVVAPSNAYDAKGMLKAALRDGNPVLMFEHKLLYGSKGARAEPGAVDATSEIPNDDYIVPLGKAVVRRQGGSVTVLAWLLMLHYAMQATQDLDAEVIDVRSLSPIDWETIGVSVRKTERAVIVEEGPITGGVGAELAAGIAERWPGTRIVRVASPDVPVPFAPVLENTYRPDPQRIASSVRHALERNHG
jgi:pyruvate dehydrogenase E1 component beta subunit